MATDSTPACTIRAATQRDLAEIVRLNAFVQTQHVAAHPEVFRVSSEGECIELFQDLVNEQTNRFWLAHVQHKVVGYAWARLERKQETVLKQPIARVYLHQICVDPDVRGRGIGHALVEAIMRYAEEHSVREVVLDTWEFNESAQRFFAREGFEVYRYHMRRRW